MRVFGHHLSRAAVTLAGIELLLVYACMLVVVHWTAHQHPISPLVHMEAVVAAFVMISAMALVGLYEEGRRTLTADMNGLADIFRAAFGVLLGVAVLTILTIHQQLAIFDARNLAIGGGLVLSTLVLERLFFWRATGLSLFKRRLLVIGVGPQAAAIENALTSDSLYAIVSYLNTGQEQSIALPAERVMDLPSGRTLLDIAREQRTEEIIVAIGDRRGSLPVKQLLECKLQGITITDLPTFFEREHQKIQLESLNASWLIFGTGFRQHWFGNGVKRGFDLLVSLLILLAASPVMVATAIAIRLEGPGPILYWQIRVGRGNQPFEICKFRSMRSDAESDGLPRWAEGDDDRITRVGRVIRKFRIDELPQAYNVLKGEMSFVGPRPERPFFVDQLSTEIPYFLARHSIRPGITGWAQVRYPYGASVEDATHKLQYDLYYVKNHTLFLDLVIMLETVRVVMFSRGAR